MVSNEFVNPYKSPRSERFGRKKSDVRFCAFVEKTYLPTDFHFQLYYSSLFLLSHWHFTFITWKSSAKPRELQCSYVTEKCVHTCTHPQPQRAGFVTAPLPPHFFSKGRFNLTWRCVWWSTHCQAATGASSPRAGSNFQRNVHGICTADQERRRYVLCPQKEWLQRRH